MSIDHGKVLALAERVAGLAHMTLGKESREEREAIERELRALAQPAEAVEGDPWIDDAPLPEGYRVEEFVPRRWYWCTQDAAGAWISDGTYYGSYAATVVAAWRDHSETLKQAPTDAAQVAVAPMLAIPEHIALYQGPDDCPHLQLNGTSVAIFPAGSWAAICDALDSITGSKATHPQAATAQGDGWKLVPVEPTAEMLRIATGAMNYSQSYETADDCYRAMLASAPSPEPPTAEECTHKWNARNPCGACKAIMHAQAQRLPADMGRDDGVVEMAAIAVFAADSGSVEAWPTATTREQDFFRRAALAALSATPDWIDAARYRWLRNAEAGALDRPFIAYRNGNGFSQFIGEYADNAIDAAISSEPTK